MAFDGLCKFPVQLKNLASRTIRTCTRPVLNHPFVVAVLLFVVFLYRSSPFLFSLLLSATPVLVCTAVLLGTLLCFADDPQIPDSDKSSLTAIPLHNKSTNIFHEDVRQISVAESKKGGLSPWHSREIYFDQQRIEESSNEYKSHEAVITNGNHGKVVAFDDHMNDHFESSSFPWTRVNGDEEENVENEEEEEFEPSDSGSDGAESSSPEQSMADIIPLLNEIDPLIECENSALLSSINSDEETENDEEKEHQAEEDAAENDDDEEQHEANKEDADESAITWTENDQKNLMDLGSSELERNQRLESLIARRRARRSMNERNLIDLDGIDLPFHVPTISTTRQNPFDFPNVTYDDIGLPPVPGSAPSILLPRRNPFDLPYDSSEEKPDLTGDTFQQEFTPLSQKDPVFRRHESFNIGSSFSQFPKKDGRSSRLRPYFVSDRLASEGPIYSLFMRQSSEASDSSSFLRQTSELSTSVVSESSSKASSLAEIEQVCVEEVIPPESEKDHGSVHVEHGSQSSQILDDQYENRDFDVHMPEIRLGEPEASTCADLNEVMLNLESGGNDSNILTWLATNVDVKENHDTSSSSSSTLSEDEMETEVNKVDQGTGLNFIEIYNDQAEKLFEASEFDHDSSTLETGLMLETIEEEHISSSSSSVVLEESNNIDESSDVPVLDVSSSSHTMDLDDTHFEEPVYDSSPRAAKIQMLEEFAESDVEQEIDGLLGKNDEDGNHRAHREVSETVVDKEVTSSTAQADLISVANEITEKTKLVDEDALFSKEKLSSVVNQDHSLKDDGSP